MFSVGVFAFLPLCDKSMTTSYILHPSWHRIWPQVAAKPDELSAIWVNQINGHQYSQQMGFSSGQTGCLTLRECSIANLRYKISPIVIQPQPHFLGHDLPRAGDFTFSHTLAEKVADVAFSPWVRGQRRQTQG